MCSTRLAADNKGYECSRCAAGFVSGAPVVPADFWLRPALADALHSRNIGRVFLAYRKSWNPWISQTRLAEWLDLTQGRISELERSRRAVTDLDRLERWCDVLRVPPRLRWFASRSDTANSGPEYAEGLPATVAVVAVLGRQDMERRAFLAGALFSVAASVGPSRDWLVATLDGTGAGRSVGGEQVAEIRRTFAVFQELDVMRGGGHAREQLSKYLTSQVVPLLRENDPASDSGRALFEAAAEQLYLLGWMGFDNGEHSSAQRYLVQALRLAEAAGSPELGAHVLAGLSDQATLTGHPDHGVQLARAGRVGLAQGHSNACAARLWALQAKAEGAMGDAGAVVRSVGQAEAAFGNIDLDDEPEWARFIDAAYVNGEFAHAFRDLACPEEATRYATVSATESERLNRARRGAMAQATLARAALDSHDLEAAATAGSTAVKLAATVTSTRSTAAIHDLRTRLMPHRAARVVREFFSLSTALLPAAGV
ncbi:hypothetical protein GCM10022243_63080 [Saccharothrix violaceirubra]